MKTLPIMLAAGLLAAPALAQPRIVTRTNRQATAQTVDSRTDTANPAGLVSFWLTLLHASDGESQLVNAGAGALADFGGSARFKTLADQLKAQAAVYPADPVEKGVVLLSSGDNFLAGPEFNASLTAGVPYYDSIALDLIGFNALTLGNHDFDFGPDVAANFISGFTTPVPFLSANLNFTAEPALQALVNTGRIAKSMILTVGSKQIGVVGATTESLRFISSPRNVGINPVLPAVQAEIDSLTASGVDIIILSTHLQSFANEYSLVPLLRGVDIVIAGGGSELLANPGTPIVPGDTIWPTNLGGTGYPRVNTDADGKTVRLVATDGDYKYIGRLVVGFDAAGEIVAVDPISGPVRVSGVAPDAVSPDPLVQSLVVDPVSTSVAALAANVIAQTEVPLDGVRSNVRTRETNLGNLVADSMLYNATRLAADFGVAAPDVALQNGGGMRNNAVIAGPNFTELDTFSVLPFANFVSLLPGIPAAQFKEILENAVSRVQNSDGRFAQIAGFRFTYDAAGTAQIIDPVTGVITTPGTRVREVVLNDGRVIVRGGQVAPGAPSVNVATIDFLASGGDQYPFRGAPFTSLGISYQQSLFRYVVDFLGGRISSLDYPVGGEQRITRIN